MAIRVQRQRRRLPVQEVTVSLDPTLEDVRYVWDTMQHDHLPWYWTDYAPRTFEALLEAFRHDTLMMVGKHGTEIMGAVFLNNLASHPATGAPLHCSVDIYVLPAYRGKLGLRFGLLAYETILGRLAFQQFFCTVRVPNKASQRFCARLGLWRCGIIPCYLPVDGVLEDVVVYAGLAPQQERGPAHE